MTDEAKDIVEALIIAGDSIFDNAADLIESLSAELEQVKAERDALLVELRGDCGICAHWQECRENDYALDRNYNSCWEWRGVQEDGRK